MLSLSDSILFKPAVFLPIDILIVGGILFRHEFLQNQLLAGRCLTRGEEEICTKIMIVYQRFAGATRPDSDQLESAYQEQRDLEVSSSDPCWCPDVCDCWSPLAPPIFPSFDMKEAWPLLSEAWFEAPLCLPYSLLAAVASLINKLFLTPNSDVLSFGLSKCQTHGLWTSNNWSSE